MAAVNRGIKNILILDMDNVSQGIYLP
jgi:hypothetical protein